MGDINGDGIVQRAELAIGGDIVVLATPEIAGLPYVISGLVALTLTPSLCAIVLEWRLSAHGARLGDVASPAALHAFNETFGFLASLTALALLAASTVASAQAPEWKKLRIGVEGAYPPFSEVGPDGKLKGFEIDLANALCAEMKAECTLVQQDFDGLIPALQSRKVDAIFASVSITEERQKVIAFSKPYYNTPARLIAKAGAKLAALGVLWEPLADDPAALIDRLSLVMMAGQMPSAMRTTLINYVSGIPNTEPGYRAYRAVEAASLIINSPQYSVQR